MATSPSCCRRSSTTGARRRGRARCARAACASGSSAWRRRSCRSCSTPTPTSSSRASPRRRCVRLIDGRALSRHRRQPGTRRPRRRCRFPRGTRCCGRAAACACRSPAGRWAARCRCSPAAAARSSAPTARTGSSRRTASRSVGNILDELSYLARHARPRARRLSRSAVHAGPRSRARAVRRHPVARPDAHVRVRDAARSPRRRAADDDAPGRPARDELRRRGGVAGDAEEGRPAADSRDAPARDRSRTAASSASSPRRSTCSGSPRTRGSRSRATIDYSLELGSTVAQFKILTPYPGTPLYKRMEPLITETDWEQFDGFTPTFTSSESDRTPNCSSCSAARIRGSTCGRRSWRTTCASRRRGPRAWSAGSTRASSAGTRRRETALMERALSC